MSFLDGFQKGLGSLFDFNKVIYSFRRMLFRSVIELMFLFLGLVCVILGMVLFVSKYIGLDIVLIVIGLLLINVWLIVRK